MLVVICAMLDAPVGKTGAVLVIASDLILELAGAVWLVRMIFT